MHISIFVEILKPLVKILLKIMKKPTAQQIPLQQLYTL